MREFRAHDVRESFQTIMDASLDVTGAHHVEVQVNHINRVLHVNVNGVCLLRVCEIQNFHLNGGRNWLAGSGQPGQAGDTG